MHREKDGLNSFFRNGFSSVIRSPYSASAFRSRMSMPQHMDGREALTVLVCANACAAIGVTVAVSVGLMFSPDDLAVFSKVNGVTTITPLLDVQLF